jgi:hypothetical protein
MEQREFAKHLRCNVTESENKLWGHLQAHRLNGEIMGNWDCVLATALAAATELPLSPAPLPQGERGENRYSPTTFECTPIIQK